MPNIDLMLAVILGILLGAGLMWAGLGGRVRDARDTQSQQATELAQLRERAALLHAELERERAVGSEKIAALEEARGVFADAFRALSTEALHRNNQAFLDLAKGTLEKHQETAKGDLEKRQQAIGELVMPIRASLEKFELQVQGVEKARIDAYATLFEQVRALGDGQGQLRRETANLVRALRAPHARGRWGELQLKRVVEMAGMLDHCDFYEQESADGDEGKLRPDLIVRLPGGKQLVVDAKAPLAAYLDAIEAEDDETRRKKLHDHARQVREHIAKLSRKSYWEQFQPAPDFVVLFLPGEMFYSAALEVDPGLIESGVEQRVILATPTTLIALLRAAAYGWQQEALTENAQKISQLGKELYERLGTLAEHWASVGKNLADSVSAYNKATGSLESRVLVTARRFKELQAVTGDKEIRDLQPVDSAPRLPLELDPSPSHPPPRGD